LIDMFAEAQGLFSGGIEVSWLRWNLDKWRETCPAILRFQDGQGVPKPSQSRSRSPPPICAPRSSNGPRHGRQLEPKQLPTPCEAGSCPDEPARRRPPDEPVRRRPPDEPARRTAAPSPDEPARRRAAPPRTPTRAPPRTPDEPKRREAAAQRIPSPPPDEPPSRTPSPEPTPFLASGSEGVAKPRPSTRMKTELTPRSEPVERIGWCGSCGTWRTDCFKSGDWLCRRCDNHNYAVKMVCGRCRKMKQGEQHLPSQPMDMMTWCPTCACRRSVCYKIGDWMCVCGNHNYGAREAFRWVWMCYAAGRPCAPSVGSGTRSRPGNH
jgi:hypothetical protein